MTLFTVPQQTVEMHGLRLDIAGVSAQGPRSENQDAFVIDAFASTGIVAVADGTGGEKSGRVAADTALRAIVSGGPIRSLDAARRAVRIADGQVTEAAAQNPSAHGGMGCALGVLSLNAVRGEGVSWIGAHVGDVRIISRSPDGAIRLETRDHTPAFARWEAGEITLDEIPDTAGANRLQRAVGRGGEADVTWLPARPGWSWLIISDGVYKAMRLDELGEIMRSGSAAAACEAIRAKVEERGPDDNYTAVLIRALGDGAAVPVSTERTDPMLNPRSTPPAPAARSTWGMLALLLSLAALGLAGFAVWSARQASAASAERTEVQALRAQVDSLRAQLGQMRASAPFGPATGPAVAPVPGDTARTPIPTPGQRPR